MFHTIDRPSHDAVVDDPSGHHEVSPLRRTRAERALWGAAPEFCTECGIEVQASQVIRYSGQRVYCSVEHAVSDE